MDRQTKLRADGETERRLIMERRENKETDGIQEGEI